MRPPRPVTSFMSVFVIMAQFSVAAGVLLIFLTFVMLAAERKTELGTARALGTQHGHVIRMFTYEGAIYALVASAIGSVLGLGVGWGMVKVMASAFSQFDLQFSFHSRPGEPRNRLLPGSTAHPGRGSLLRLARQQTQHHQGHEGHP